LKAEAKRTGAVIYFADEAGVRSDFHAGPTRAPVGRPPTVKTTGRRREVVSIHFIGIFYFGMFADQAGGRGS
jgi:hypothetical protein